MLYPKEDVASRTPKYSCRNCGYEEDASSSEKHRVYRNVIKTSVDPTQGHPAALKDLKLDPTLPRSTLVCPNENCESKLQGDPPQYTEAVYFTASGAAREQSMTLYFVCSTCAHSW